MNKKKKMHPILKILCALFIVYIALFIANMSGYYEGRVRSRVELTNEKILEDYSNSFSNFGEKLTANIENVVKDGMHIIGNVFKSLF